MTPLEALRFSVRKRCYTRKEWLLSAFALTRDSDQKTITYPGQLSRTPYGLYMANDDLELIKIEPYDLKVPLFDKAMIVTITPDWVLNLKEPKVETRIGTLLINLVCLIEAFGDRIPYQNGKLMVSALDNMICAKMKSLPPPGKERLAGEIYVDDRFKFIQGVAALEALSNIFAHSVTEAGLRPAPGREEFKKTLLKKYEGRLQDPVEMSNFEKELRVFDDAYLKVNDPSFDKFNNKKARGFRQKAYMTQGGSSDGFTGKLEVVPVIQSQDEGISLQANAFAAAVNEIRYGSFARGVETINGGVVSKGIQRASDSWRIIEGDCGTKLGFKRLYSEDATINLVGRYILSSKGPVLIENEASAKIFSGKEVLVRSPQYCRLPGHQTCAICAGTAISQFPNGMPIPLMEVSGGVTTDSLKLMHNSQLTTVTVNLKASIT